MTSPAARTREGGGEGRGGDAAEEKEATRRRLSVTSQPALASMPAGEEAREGGREGGR